MNKYVKNYLLSVLNTVLGLLFPIITFPYVSRVLGPDKLGAVNFVQSYGYYFVHLASFGINSYAIREVSKVRDDKEKVTKVSNEIYNINLFFSIISTVVYFLIVLATPKLRTDFILYAVYSLIIISNFLTLEWLLQSYDDYMFTTVRSTIIRIISLVAVFVFIHGEGDYIKYMLISTIAEMGSRISCLIYSRKEYVKLVVNSKYLNFKAHIKQLFTLFTFRLVNGISANLDKLMIGFMLAYVNVGLYSAGVKFNLMLVPIIETIGIVLFPKINISASNSKEEYLKILRLNYDLILLIGMPMMVGMFLISPRLILLMAGEEYVASITVSRIMSLIIILCPIGDMLGSKTLLVHGKDKELLISSSVVAISNIVFNVICIPIWGINGAAIASVISYIVAVVMRLYFTKKINEFRILTLSAVKYFMCTIPFIIGYLVFREQIDNSNVGMFVFIAFCIIAYILELIITKDYFVEILREKLLSKRKVK